MYPANDEQFEDTHVAKVRGTRETGWDISRADGWSFFVPGDSQIEPEEGMPARFYGKGIGFPVRGLFLAGVRVFYSTEAEQQEKHEIDTYGADAADWLKRWDDGKSCWTIEMGGLGPGYEQCIHITATEILRHMLAKSYDVDGWTDPDQWKKDHHEIETAGFANPTIQKLGLSGAQWGSALNLAAMFYRQGPRAVMTDERVKDRHIQVQRTFPVPA
ncbi:MAG: hypothetical protein JWQ10_288 [Herbaspirillum sp.]|nr:hypothetical protein [Herbaspirillum sp.]